MVMQRSRRVLTVEEARNLPPPTEEEIAQRRESMAGFLEAEREISASIVARPGGRPFTEEELEDLVADDEDDENFRIEAPGR